MKYWTCVLILTVAAGCHSLPNPFVRLKPDYSVLPADALRDIAGEIEKAVQKGDREPKIADAGGIVINTDGIMQAIRMRAARAELLNQLLDSGHACETPNGLASILRTSAYKKATTSKQRDRNAYLVMNENSDRWALYEGIVKSSNLSPRARSAVQDAFHLARVANMPDGQKYEDASGKTIIKGKK